MQLLSCGMYCIVVVTWRNLLEKGTIRVNRKLSVIHALMELLCRCFSTDPIQSVLIDTWLHHLPTLDTGKRQSARASYWVSCRDLITKTWRLTFRSKSLMVLAPWRLPVSSRGAKKPLERKQIHSNSGLLPFNKPEKVLWTITKYYYYHY